MSRQLVTISGVTFSGSGYTQVIPSAYEIAINKLAHIRFWMSPETRFEGLGPGNGLRDRISRVDGTEFSTYGYTLGATLPNSQPSLVIASTGSPTFIRQAIIFTGLDLSFLASGYSKIIVVNKTTDSTFMPLIAMNDKLCDVTMGTNGRIEINHGSGSQVYQPGVVSPGAQGAAHVIMVSWNATTKALVVEIDGVAKSLTASTLTTVPVVASITKMGIGGMDTGSNLFSSGAIGEAFILDTPLADSANLTLKRAFYAQLNSKYGFTLPVS